MHPELFTIGPFTVYSYGLMLGVGFLVAARILGRELGSRGIDPAVGNTIVLLVIIFGVIGSKLLYVLEHIDSFSADPGILISPGGLTWYGGFFLATFTIWRYTVRKGRLGMPGLKFSRVCDSAAAPLMLGYGIARIGCHLAGDGDYGIPTDLPWAAVYEKGTFPPSLAFRNFPEIVAQYGVNGVVPDTIPVHPAPLYELCLGLIGFFILRAFRKSGRLLETDGRMFMLYLVLAGTARFGVEFIRVNPRILAGLSEAQLISAALIIAGAAGWFKLRGGTGPC